MKINFAFLILRLGLGIVFFLFGIGKFQDDVWAQTIKTMDFFLKLPWSVTLSVAIIGVSETITGCALILGLFTRIFASLAALQLTGILILLSFQETRDIGLLGAALYLALKNDEAPNISWFLSKRKGGG